MEESMERLYCIVLYDMRESGGAEAGTLSLKHQDLTFSKNVTPSCSLNKRESIYFGNLNCGFCFPNFWEALEKCDMNVNSKGNEVGVVIKFLSVNTTFDFKSKNNRSVIYFVMKYWSCICFEKKCIHSVFVNNFQEEFNVQKRNTD